MNLQALVARTAGSPQRTIGYRKRARAAGRSKWSTRAKVAMVRDSVVPFVPGLAALRGPGPAWSVEELDPAAGGGAP